jgi:hypothetical protein
VIRDIDGLARYTDNQGCSLIYEYLRHDAAIQSPPETILKLQNLFGLARNVEIRVSQALEKIIFSANQQFDGEGRVAERASRSDIASQWRIGSADWRKSNRHVDIFLSQCFYSILDCWLETPESINYVPQLFGALETIGTTKSHDRRRKQLTQLIAHYFLSDSYFQLKTIVALIMPPQTAQVSLSNSLATDRIPSTDSNNNIDSDSNPIINNYLIRYPYLYQYLLPEDIHAPNLVSLMKKLEENSQKDFEIKLSKHIIYRFRLKQLAKMKLMSKGAGKMITKAENPSLLSEAAFRIALQQYIGKIDNKSSLLERSQLFIVENERRLTYKKFKQDLYLFLVSNIQTRNSTYRFDSRLKEKLKDIFAHSDAKPLNRTLILQTCRQLFSFLIIDTAINSDSSKFAELIANLGTAQVMGILVKVTLICPESKADLAKKIYLIVTHYQLQTVQEAPWLLKSLEYLLIAFSIYFGKIDVSIAKSAVSQ